MANLLNEFVDGANTYKSILNLGTAIGTPLDTTLRPVTDGMGTVSPLQLSTTQVRIYYPNGTFNGGLSITGGADGGAGTTSFVDFIPNKSTPTYYHAIGFTYDNSNWLGFYRGSRASAVLAFGNNLIWTPSYNVAIGHTSASARLHVRGDGTNPIARFEDSVGVEGLSLTATLATFAQRIIVTALPATRPATAGEFYQDTAANILANGDLVVGIRQ